MHVDIKITGNFFYIIPSLLNISSCSEVFLVWSFLSLLPLLLNYSKGFLWANPTRWLESVFSIIGKKRSLQGRRWVEPSRCWAGTWHRVGQALQRALGHIKMGSGVFTPWKIKYLHSFLLCPHCRFISYSSQVHNTLYPFTFFKPWRHFHMLFSP